MKARDHLNKNVALVYAGLIVGLIGFVILLYGPGYRLAGWLFYGLAIASVVMRRKTTHCPGCSEQLLSCSPGLGTHIRDAMRFCPYCGFDLETEMDRGPTQHQEV